MANAKKTGTTDLAVKKTQDLSNVDYGDDADSGYENQTNSDIALPFIAILQALSPQCTSDTDRLAPGQLFNTVTEDTIDGKTGFLFVPSVTTHTYVEWIPRTSGGGFVGVHAVDSSVVRDAQDKSKGMLRLKNGLNDLVETFSLYGIICDEDSPLSFAVLSFVSTKIKVYKGWNTKTKMFLQVRPDGLKVHPPLFANLVRVTTVKDKNNKGEFFNFKLSPAVESMVSKSLIPPSDPRYIEAKTLCGMVLSGVAKADIASQERTSSSPGAREEEAI